MKTFNTIRSKGLSVILVVFTTLNLSFHTQAQEEVSASNDRGVTTVQSINGKYTYKKNDPFNSYNIETKGKIVVSDDDKDIVSISSGGYFEVSKTTFGSKRSIVISPQGGTLKKEYYEGRSKTDWEPEGKKWLAEILPDIVKTTMIGAESRVDRFYKKGGTKAVLDEISNLEGSYTQSGYATLLMEKRPPEKDFSMIISRMSSLLSSDYYAAKFLQDNSKVFMQSKDASEAYFKAAAKIKSDYYKATVLQNGLKNSKYTSEHIHHIVNSAIGISSDYYLSNVLVSVLDHQNLDEKTFNRILESAANIKSDNYKTTVLSKALAKSDDNELSYAAALQALSSMSSDYYKATVFSKISDKNLSKAEQIQLIKIISDNMGSDYYAAQSLSKVASGQQMEAEVFNLWTNAAGALGSDYYSATTLQGAVKHAKSKSQIINIIEAAGNIKSDHYLTVVLTSIAPQVRGDSELKEAYRNTAKRIKSETYYGRALKAIE